MHVSPAPEDDPGPSARINTASGQNTGVDGAKHAVADTGPAASGAEPSVNQHVAPINEEIANPELSGTKILYGSLVSGDDARQESASDQEPETGYDETSAPVHEVQPHGFEVLGLGETAHPDDDRQTPASPPQEPPTLEQTAIGDIPALPEDSGPQPMWNQTMASAPQPVEGERDRRDNPFGRILGRREDGAAQDDGGQPMTRFQDLPLDQKMRIWRLRAVIVIIVGIVFTIIASWEAGVTLAIIAGIADTIYRARSAGAPAWAQPGAVDRDTLRAQKRTMRQLAGMARAGYLALNRRPIPDSVEVIDHLVVGPTGVYAIDSEKWDKDLPIRTRNGRQLWLGPESKKDRLQHAHWEAGQASELLSARLGMKVRVQPALAIYGPKIPWDIAEIRGVDVFSGDRLKKYLRSRTKRKGVPQLSHEQIAKIRDAAADVLPLEWQDNVTPVG